MILYPRPDRQISPIHGAVILAGVFLLERFFLAAIGVRFNVESLSWYWQILDPVVLKEHLVQSLFFLHAQPPAFNLVLGLALKLGPTTGLVVLHGLFLCLGMTLAMALFVGLLDLGWAPRTAVLAVAVCALSPGWIVYENWLFYDFPVLVLLAVAFVALLRFGREGRVRYLSVFVVTLTALTLTRSLFHLGWLIGSVWIILALRSRCTLRQWCCVLALPLLLTGGWYAKNQCVFGFFGSSSWLGLSLAKTATARLDPAERAAMVTKGMLSSYALIKPYSPLEDYEAVADIRYSDSTAPALGQRTKVTGQPNFNHLGFVDVSDQCRSDALKVIAGRPSVYADSVATAARRFFTSGVAYPPFLENLVVIAPVFRFGEKTWSSRAVVSLAFFGALVFSVLAAVGARRSENRAELALRLWVIWTLMWVLVVGSLVEVGENHRFRFLVTPLVWLSLADAGRRLSTRLRRNERSTPNDQR